MHYVDGNPVRGNYKAPNWQRTHKLTAYEKAQQYASGAGQAIGLGVSIYQAYQTIRPALMGLGLLR